MRKIGVLLMIALMLALVPTVLAGGWAVITLDDMPGEIRAGEPWTAGFTVMQHGQTPVHKLDDGSLIEPTLVATNPTTGERVEVVATPTKEVGHFMLEVTFPSEGAWEWTIYPAPLAGETEFEPLNVLPAAAAVVAPAAPIVAPAVPVAEPLVVNEPVEAAAPTAPNTSTVAGAGGGFPTSTVLRWGALIVALAAVVLFIIQGRRRAQPAGVES